MQRVTSRVVLPLAIIFGLAGCVMGNPQGSARTADFATAAIGQFEAQNWALAELDIVVPRSLTVSEENTIKPRVDIVWREDPRGDRHQQVDALMTEALAPVLARLDGGQPVVITLQVTRFHALTERTRYTTGGEHEIEFILTVTDARSGAVLRGPRPVDVTFPGSGGDTALAEEARGYFQRDAIRDRLVAWALAEFRLGAAPGVS